MLKTKELRAGDFGQNPAKHGVCPEVRILKDLGKTGSRSAKEKRQLEAGATTSVYDLAYEKYTRVLLNMSNQFETLRQAPIVLLGSIGAVQGKFN